MRRDDALEQEMEREMQFHLDMATKRNVERGMTPDAARRQARLAFGSSGVVVESARDAHRARTVETSSPMSGSRSGVCAALRRSRSRPA